MQRFLLFLWFICNGFFTIAQVSSSDSIFILIKKDPQNISQHLAALQKKCSALEENALLLQLTKSGEFIGTLDPISRIQVYRALGQMCWFRNLYSESLNFYDQAIAVAVNEGNDNEAGQSYFELAGLFIKSQMYPEALQRIYKADQFFEKSKNKIAEARAHGMAAAVGFWSRYYSLSLEEAEEALKLYQLIEPGALTKADSFEIMRVNNTRGLAYVGLHNLDKGMSSYNEAERFAILLKQTFWIGLINGNKSEIFIQRGDIPSAIAALKTDIKQSLAFQQWASALNSSLFLTRLFIKTNDWKQAQCYLDTANMLGKQHGTSQSSRSLYFENQSKILAKNGDHARAYEALKNHLTLKDSLEETRQSVALAQVKTSREIGEKESQIALLTTENELRSQQIAYKNIIVIATTITIALLFVLGIVINRNYRIKNADNRLLSKQNDEINAINEELRSSAEILATQNETIQKLNDDLESRVKLRTQELEEANGELDMFLYRASHDIRRPITTLLGLSNLANSTIQEAGGLQLFDRVIETASSMDSMLFKFQMIYVLNRPLGSGSQITLSQSIVNALQKFSVDMKKAGIDFNLQIKEPVDLIGDESVFSIIFQNLIENAITFRKPDDLEKPQLWIEAEQNENHVIIKIRDNGIGIERDYIPKIFDLHYRGTALSRGNGLGLYLVKKAVTLLKGNIEVQTNYGVGTSFLVYFPRTVQAKS
jgi:signal transduction histidine kinase